MNKRHSERSSSQCCSFEPDALLEQVFGSAVRDIRFFRFASFEFEGHAHNIARSGYSKQGGYELYVGGADQGMAIWQALMQAGKALDARAGCPNLIERIEGGLLSYGNDMTSENNPFECGIGKFVTSTADYIGCAALEQIRAVGHEREISAVEIEGAPVPPCDRPWALSLNGAPVGQVTSAAWSPDHKANVAVAMIARAKWDAGTRLDLTAPDGPRVVQVRDRFWT